MQALMEEEKKDSMISAARVLRDREAVQNERRAQAWIKNSGHFKRHIFGGPHEFMMSTLQCLIIHTLFSVACELQGSQI